MKTPFYKTLIIKQKGFNLIELLTTVIIIGIVLAIGVPSFQQFVQKNQTITNANNLTTALNMARSEAVKRGAQVTVLQKGGVNNVWSAGWDVFTDVNNNGTFNDDGDANLCETGEDCLLRTYGPLPNNFTLQTGNNYANWLAYLPSGLPQGSGPFDNDTFRLCSNAADITKSRSITINTLGRPRVITGTASCP